MTINLTMASNDELEAHVRACLDEIERRKKSPFVNVRMAS